MRKWISLLLLCLAALLVLGIAHVSSTDGPGEAKGVPHTGDERGGASPLLRGAGTPDQGMQAGSSSSADAGEGALTGFVCTSDGDAVAGARVEICQGKAQGARASRGCQEILGETASDARGRFRAVLSDRRPIDVRVSARGLAESILHGVRAGQDLLVVLYPCALLRVVAEDPSGELVSSAKIEVTVAPGGGGLHYSSQATDESGLASFPCLPIPGRYVIAGWHETHGEALANFDLEAARETPFLLRFEPGRVFQGYVLDAASGRGVPAVHLISRPGDRTLGVTDASGHFRLCGWTPAPAPYGVLVATARGYVPASVLPTCEAEMTIRLLRAATNLRGRVLTSDGSPACGGVVDVWRSGHPGNRRLHVTSASCDGDGSFAALVAPGLRYGLRVKCPGSGTLRLDVQVPAGAGDTWRVGPIRLPAAAGLSGELVAEDDAPVAAARVRLRRVREPGDLEGTPVPVCSTTDSAGRFFYEDLAPGCYVLGATTPDGVHRRRWEVVLQEGATPHCKFVLAALGSRRLLVRVLSPAGAPVARVNVRARSSAGSSVWRTDELGQALIRAPSEIRWFEVTGSVLEEAGWTAPSFRIPHAAATIEVRLVDRIVMRGKVLADGTGEPLPELAVHVRNSDGKTVARSVTDILGEFECRVREDVEGALEVALTGYRIGFDAGEQLRSPSRWSGAVTVDFPLSQCVTIHARAEDRVPVDFLVQDPAGQEAPHAIVVIRPRSVGGVWTGRCDESGRWRCEGLESGATFRATARPQLHVAREHGWWSSRMVEGVVGETHAVTLRFEQAILVRGRIDRGDEAEPGEALVRVAGRHGRLFEPVRSGIDGVFSIWLPEYVFPVTLLAYSGNGTAIGSAKVQAARDVAAGVVIVPESE